MPFFRPRLLAFLLAAMSAAPVAAEDAACPQFAPPAETLPTESTDQVVLTADQAMLTEQGLSLLSGSVRLMQGDRQFSAEAVEFDRTQNQVRINARSLFRNKNLIVRSRSAQIDLTDETASFFGTDFTVPDRAARGEADKFLLARTGVAQMKQVSYTTCAPGSSAWLIKASSIRLDPEEGVGSASNARLTIADVPILYLPYFQFPIDGRRRSGFLFPTMGNSDNTGLDLRWPYYLNLAPNYDATIAPRQMGRRGLQLDTEFRYLLPHRYGEGSLGYEHLDRDEVTDARRSLFEVEHRGLVNRRMAFEARYAEVSDETYFEDLGGRLEAASITHLERSAQLTYVAPSAYTVTSLVQDFQTVDRKLAVADDPYRRLPLLRIDAGSSGDWHGLSVGASGEYVNFEHASREQGQRVGLQSQLRWLQDRSAWYSLLRADYHVTRYKLTSRDTAGDPTEPLRTLPVLSAEGGLRFERTTAAGALQTLEPRLFYLYVPFRDQDDLPLFDSGEPDFDFVQLFAHNRFSGEDRVADANHLATAFTSRLLDPADGSVKLSASLGQIYRFHAPRVTLEGATPPDEGGTDVIGALDYRLSGRWSAGVATQWSPSDNQLSRNSLVLRYRDANRYSKVNYRYRRDILEQADWLLSTPVYGPWKLLGRWRFSLEDDQTLEALGGLQYDTCCWSVRTAYRRYIANTAGDYSTGIYIQIELKGLSRIGPGLEDLEPDLR
ncbi:MAG: LPS assembly protein LptD [Gammaproteobacteria bacterium]|nr:LPS assembly protein LptD [Gammaproteobacteria bacterium]